MEGNCRRMKNLLQWEDLTKQTMAEGPNENFPFDVEDMQIGERSPEFNLFADLKKFNKPSGHERNGSEKQEDKERKFNFGISDEDFFDQSDKTPALKSSPFSKNTGKKSQKEAKETGEEPEDTGFKGIFKKIATIVTQIIEGFKSMGSEVLTHLADFFNSNFFRGLAQAARKTEQAPMIREQMKRFREIVRNKFKPSTPDAIPNVTLQAAGDDDPSWDTLFEKLQTIQNSSTLSSRYSEAEFLTEATRKIRQAPGKEEPKPITVTLQELINNAPTLIVSVHGAPEADTKPVTDIGSTKPPDA